MSTLHPPTGHASPDAPHTRRLSSVWAAYALLGALLAGYLISLIARPVDQSSTWLDGWAVCAFEVVLCGLAFGYALRRGVQRGLPLALGGAILMWTLGDIALTIETLHGAEAPVPSVADVFYLAFYPIAYLALVLMVRKESSRLVPATWLDGAVAGLGASALLAAFAFHDIHRVAGGGSASVVTNLVYPVGDVLLAMMVVGGSAVLVRRRGPWLPFALGCAVTAVGDTYNLLPSAGSTHVGVVADGIAWPTAIFLMSLAVWVRPGKLNVLAHQPAPGFVLPGLGAAAALLVVLAGSASGVGTAAVALAGATLLVVGVRLALSVRSLRSLTEERHRQAVTDQLTGLGNRRRLAAVLDGLFADHADSATAPRVVSFLFVDLNHFKEVNDSFGHPAGDQLLGMIGARITPCLGDSDLLLRIGGDEFAVLLVDGGPERGVTTAARISQALSEPFELEMVSVRVGASIGIAVAPHHADDAEELMRCADQAMYRAKQSGSPFELYEQGLDHATDRLTLLDDLRAAIRTHQLEVHYQPQVNLRDGRVSAVEALVRWPHPRLGFIPPLEFIPLAEEAGLMRELTTLVLDEALAQCARWRAAGDTLSVSVNVSATNIMDTGFSDLVSDRLRHHGVPGTALVLEITETTIISDFDRCKQVVDQLCELGCVVSIDDFGAGFTSLPYLSRLTIGELKLDRTFLTELARDERTKDHALIRATVELAHALGLQVVAEGVEEQSTLDILSRLGCDMAQGYHIGRPAPAKGLSFPAQRAA